MILGVDALSLCLQLEGIKTVAYCTNLWCDYDYNGNTLWTVMFLWVRPCGFYKSIGFHDNISLVTKSGWST